MDFTGHYIRFLTRNFPNPFNPSTTIRYALPSRSYVKLEILNLLGQRIAELLNTQEDAGCHQVEWQPPSSVASGVCLYRIEAVSLDASGKRFQKTKKMLLLRKCHLSKDFWGITLG